MKGSACRAANFLCTAPCHNFLEPKLHRNFFFKLLTKHSAHGSNPFLDVLLGTGNHAPENSGSLHGILSTQHRSMQIPRNFSAAATIASGMRHMAERLTSKVLSIRVVGQQGPRQWPKLKE
jgi:hypothetical protein